MVLNISPDHLDRYDSYEHYAMTKATVFDNLETGALALLDADDEWTPRFRERAGAALRLIGSDFARIQGDGPGHALLVDGETYDRGTLQLPRSAQLEERAVRHRRGAAPRGLGRRGSKRAAHLRRPAPPHGVRARARRGPLLQRLQGHQRRQRDGQPRGPPERFVLIAGGRAKGDDLTPLGALLRERGRGLVAVGESAAKFEALADGHLPHARRETMADAVAAARQMAEPGDLVILAPACSSFDQYRSYAERGERFTDAVLDLR